MNLKRMTRSRAFLIAVPLFALVLIAIMSQPAATQRGDVATRGVMPVGEIKQWANSIGMTFVRIDPGKFMMGTPENEPGRYPNEALHEVRITRGYLLGAYEVTRGQFRVFVNDTGFKTDAEKRGFALLWTGKVWEKRRGGSWRNVGFEQTDDHPVVSMSWNDAVAFIRWLSRKERRLYRLPTEAEWEYACRAGTRTAYPWGDNPDAGGGFANAADQSARRQFPKFVTAFKWDDGFVYTAPVGEFKPNPWGLYDMIGNALEWCSDYYGPFAFGETLDPKGPPQGDQSGSRVLRGGSWTNRPLDIRTGFRHWHAADYQCNVIGFRLALNSL
jgi:formylglycine-generating enzyme